MKIKCDLTPTTALILADRRASLGLPKALAEPVDNSLDAGATEISIDVSGAWLTISDNGKGCDDPELMLRIGRHAAASDHTVGRYGIGLKKAAIWLSRCIEIVSSTGTRTIRVVADWDLLAAKNDWAIDANINDGESERGTEIRFEVCENRANSKALSAAKAFLADIFSPAIDAGRQIYFDGEALLPVPIPALERVITHDGAFNGKPYHLTAGLLPSASDRCGYRIAFRHRVLEKGVLSGCGDYNPSRFFAYLVLDETDKDHRWQLDQYKHGFEERDALLEELLPVVEPLLAESQERSQNVEIAELTRDVELSLASALAGMVRLKAKRPGERHPGSGTIKPRNTGRKQKKINHLGDEPGNYDSDRPGQRNVLRVQIYPFTETPDKLGMARRGGTAGTGCIWISLNSLHPHVDWAVHHRDPLALRQIATTIFAAETVLGDLQIKLPFDGLGDYDRFMAIMARGLNLPSSTAKETGPAATQANA